MADLKRDDSLSKEQKEHSQKTINNLGSDSIVNAILGRKPKTQVTSENKEEAKTMLQKIIAKLRRI